MTIALDLTLFIKEAQLQHGLRSDDYTRYHGYLSNRLATLRKQLNLSNDRKKFLNKNVTPANATDARHLMLLALYAERCWATAESIAVTRQAFKTSATGTDAAKPRGGIPPHDLAAKRLNKSVKWAEKLCTVARAVGTARLQTECEAYLAETSGRCAAAHGRFEEAKQHFSAARAAYFSLRKSSSDEQWAVLRLKVGELDDRVLLCMQQLGEDPATYAPVSGGATAATGGEEAAGELAGTTLRWNNRTLSVASMKVKDALREARSVPVEAAVAKVLESVGPMAVGPSNRVLDLMDRRMNSLNDALAHARQDLRGAAEGSQARVELQLIVHYALFQVSEAALRRALFLAEAYRRRFHATERAVRAREARRRHSGASRQTGRRSELAPSQFASPLEVVRLYEAAADAVEQMELLPGVAGRSDVEEMAATVRAGKLVYTGESWRVVGDTVRAERCYRAAIAVLADARAVPEAGQLRSLAEAASLQMAAENALGGAAVSSLAAPATIPCLAEASRDEVGAADAVVRFPPDYQATACKPAFIDIASTYVEFPTEPTAGPARTDATPAGGPKAPSTQQQQQQRQHPAARKESEKGAGATPEALGDSASGGKKWGWKWGWGS